MKKKLLLIVVLALSYASYAQSYYRVNGYYRSSGKYVDSYYRTTPNNNILDNWITYPNVNPFTGKQGSIYTNIYGSSRRRLLR